MIDGVCFIGVCSSAPAAAGVLGEGRRRAHLRIHARKLGVVFLKTAPQNIKPWNGSFQTDVVLPPFCAADHFTITYRANSIAFICASVHPIINAWS